MEHISWNTIINNEKIGQEFRSIIKEFLIPDKILVTEFFSNLKIIGDDSKLASFLKLSKWRGTKSIGRFTYYIPLFYPNWFVAGYPDVVKWLIDNHEKSNLYSSLDENLIIEIDNSSSSKRIFLRNLIHEYLLMTHSVLECTEQNMVFQAEMKREYPKNDFDSKGRLVKRVFLTRHGYEEIVEYKYNKSDLVVRVDRWGEDSYGKWKLNPFKIIEFDEKGLLNKFLEYEHGGIAVDFEYSNDYDSENKLIKRNGPFFKKVSSPLIVHSKNRNIRNEELRFVYEGNKVEIFRYTKHFDELLSIEKVDISLLVNRLNIYTGVEILDKDKVLKQYDSE